MAKITPVSGFPEWLPEEKLIEQSILDTLRRTFELYGFTPLEVRSVEPLDVLLSKGDDKEIYTLRRLGESVSTPPEFGLHFDMTVPFARYMQQFRGQLTFPFKRYQIQKAWRGERPQEGRYREFYQADIDVIGEGELPISYDAEFARIMYEVLSKLPLPQTTIKINNRRLLSGFYQALGVSDVASTLRVVDKLEKIGPVEVIKQLQSEVGLSEEKAELCLELGKIRTPDSSFAQQVRAFGLENELLEQGLTELAFVMDACQDLPAGSVVADLSVARGLDYYTGTVFESFMAGFEHIGSVCSGGRYDNLASDGKVSLPGIGISFGVTRMLGPLLGQNRLQASRSSPVVVLVSLPTEEARLEAATLANRLRERGIPTDVHHAPQKFGKQIRAAERRGVPYVWFFTPGDAGSYQVKDIRSGEQVSADVDSWTPPQEDLEIQVRLLED